MQRDKCEVGNESEEKSCNYTHLQTENTLRKHLATHTEKAYCVTQLKFFVFVSLFFFYWKVKEILKNMAIFWNVRKTKCV